MECIYCRSISDDVCRSSVQAGQCERRIKPPTTGSAVKPTKTPKDQFFLAAADLCRSLKTLVDLEIEFVSKEKR